MERPIPNPGPLAVGVSIMIQIRRSAWSPPGLVALALLAHTSAPAAEPSARTIELRPKPMREFEVLLPAPRFAPVGSGFAVAHSGGQRFQAMAQGDRLEVDLDGDGTREALVEGETGFVTLKAKSPTGAPLQYSAQLRREPGEPWSYSCGGAMVGEIDGTPIQVFDQNLNGSFGDVGEDALVIGTDRVASFLSAGISIAGKLHGLEVAQDGSSLTLREPQEGTALAQVGTIDLASKFSSKAKLDAVVVTSTDGKFSFSLARAKEGLVVPAGEYRIHSGRIALGTSSASFRTGKAGPIVVKPGEKTVLEWGGPASAEFAAVRHDDQIEFTPWDIWYYGKAGEEYFNFLPLGTSPTFHVTNRETKEEILWVRFPGSC